MEHFFGEAPLEPTDGQVSVVGANMSETKTKYAAAPHHKPMPGSLRKEGIQHAFF